MSSELSHRGEMNYLIRHLKEINESYFAHLKEALGCGLLIVFAGIACIVHAFLPFLFEKTATNLLTRLKCRFDKRLGSNDK